jgi:alcohol dehydrogenase class IV
MNWRPFGNLTNYGRYTSRTPRPANPILRPAYQGSNPVADIFALWALRTTVEYLPRIAKNPDDSEARRQMLCVFWSKFRGSVKQMI